METVSKSSVDSITISKNMSRCGRDNNVAFSVSLSTKTIFIFSGMASAPFHSRSLMIFLYTYYKKQEGGFFHPSCFIFEYYRKIATSTNLPPLIYFCANNVAHLPSIMESLFISFFDLSKILLPYS